METVDIEQGATLANGVNGTHDPAEMDVGSMAEELKHNAPHFMDNMLKLRSANRYSNNLSHCLSPRPFLPSPHTQLCPPSLLPHTDLSLNPPYPLVQAPKS